jgi:lipopolysaccharide transport system permease protein
MSLEVTIHEARPHRGELAEWRSMIEDAWRARELVTQFIVRDFSARYRQSLLGYLWSVFPPIVMVAIFTLLQSGKVFDPGEMNSVPYPVFALLGLTTWGFFATGLMQMTSSMTSAAAIIKKIHFPREALIFAGVGQAAFETLVRSVLAAVLMAWFRIQAPWTALLIPLLFIPLALLTLGLGFILASLNALVRDVSAALGVVLQMALFLTPVIYLHTSSRLLSFVTHYLNPVSAFVVSIRDLATLGTLTMPAALAVSSGVSLAMFLIGWRVFRVASPIIEERL